MNNTAVVSSECLQFRSFFVLLSFCFIYKYIYKVGIENCRVYNSNVAINVPFLMTEIYLFSMSGFESCILQKKNKINSNVVIKVLS